MTKLNFLNPKPKKWNVHVFKNEKAHITNNKGEDIALIDFHMNDFSNKENRSNAKLMAAAPEMKKELLDLIPILRERHLYESAERIEKLTKKI